MTETIKPTIIKKYANRRLYHTGTSAYVTLEDLAKMVKAGEEFAVTDAKTGDDITRAVLGQIIFEQEGKDGQTLLPADFLRQLIKFYGDGMQSLVPQFLTLSIEKLAGEQTKFREQMSKTLGPVFPAQAIEMVEQHVRSNIAVFQNAMKMFSPFQMPGGVPAPGAKSPPQPAQAQSAPPAADNVESLRQELEAMRQRLDKLSRG